MEHVLVIYKLFMLQLYVTEMFHSHIFGMVECRQNNLKVKDSVRFVKFFEINEELVDVSWSRTIDKSNGDPK